MTANTPITESATETYWHEAEARKVLREWQDSGETLAGFARRHGLNRRRLTRWAARLKIHAAPVRFHRVHLCDRVTNSPTGAPIEIEVTTNGRLHRVRVASGFAAADLQRVLAVLDEAASC